MSATSAAADPASTVPAGSNNLSPTSDTATMANSSISSGSSSNTGLQQASGSNTTPRDVDAAASPFAAALTAALHERHVPSETVPVANVTAPAVLTAAAMPATPTPAPAIGPTPAVYAQLPPASATSSTQMSHSESANVISNSNGSSNRAVSSPSAADPVDLYGPLNELDQVTGVVNYGC